ncbi:hypothetical protein Tco_0723532 [Tanacetum coccineum]
MLLPTTNGKKNVRVEVGDKVMLEVSSWKDVLHFGKKDLLAPRYYWTDANLHVHLEEIKVDKTLRFTEKPVEIIDREVKSLKRSRILIVRPLKLESEILGGDQLLVILCGYGTKSLEFGTSFLSMTMFVALDRGTRSVSIVILSFKNASMGQQVQCVRNVSCPMWVLFGEGLYGERFKLEDGVGDEEDNNQRIANGLIITLPCEGKEMGTCDYEMV